MELTGLWGAFYRVSLIISKLAYVNVLWILFSLAGLILLGVAPATVALFSVTRAWARKEWDIPVFQTFWSVYKQEFWKASVHQRFFLVSVSCYIGTSLYLREEEQQNLLFAVSC